MTEDGEIGMGDLLSHMLHLLSTVLSFLLVYWGHILFVSQPSLRFVNSAPNEICTSL